MGDEGRPNTIPAHLLIQCAEWLRDDRVTPLSIPATTFADLHRLSRLCDSPSKPLGRFLIFLPYWRLEDELRRITLPPVVGDLRIAHEELQRHKEIAISDGDFARAASIKRGQDAIKEQIARHTGDFPEVTLVHFRDAIRNLGFDGTLDVY